MQARMQSIAKHISRKLAAKEHFKASLAALEKCSGKSVVIPASLTEEKKEAFLSKKIRRCLTISSNGKPLEAMVQVKDILGSGSASLSFTVVYSLSK